MEKTIKGTMHKYVYGYLEIDEFFDIYDKALKSRSTLATHILQ